MPTPNTKPLSIVIGETNRITLEPKHPFKGGLTYITLTLHPSVVEITESANNDGVTVIRLNTPPMETLEKSPFVAKIFVKEDFLNLKGLSTLIIELPDSIENLSTLFIAPTKTNVIVRSRTLEFVDLLSVGNTWLDTPQLHVVRGVIHQGKFNEGKADAFVTNPDRWVCPIKNVDHSLIYVMKFNPQDTPFPYLVKCNGLFIKDGRYKVATRASPQSPFLPFKGDDILEIAGSDKRATNGTQDAIRTYRIDQGWFNESNLTFPLLTEVEYLSLDVNCNFPVLEKIRKIELLDVPSHFPMWRTKTEAVGWKHHKSVRYPVIESKEHNFEWMFMVTGYGAPIFVEGVVNALSTNDELDIQISIGCVRLNFRKIEPLSKKDIVELVETEFRNNGMSGATWAKHKARLVKIIKYTIFIHYGYYQDRPRIPAAATTAA